MKNARYTQSVQEAEAQVAEFRAAELKMRIDYAKQLMAKANRTRPDEICLSITLASLQERGITIA